jgi:parvulin-like peptidyl-prolyl isomerase
MPPPDNSLRDLPPPPGQNSGFAPLPQDAGQPRVPQDAGFAAAGPNAGFPPPNPPDRPPPPGDRPLDNRSADAYRPAPVSPPVASGPIREPPAASRPQESQSYIPALLEPIRVASLDPNGPSRAAESAGASGGLPSAGPPPDRQSPPSGAAGLASALNDSPGAPGSASALGGSPAAGPTTGPPPASASDKQLCKGAEKVAQVGSQVILASDLNVAFNIWVENQKKSKKPLPPDQIAQHRAELEVSLLREMTEEIMVYQDIVRQVPEEALKGVRDKVSEVFETEELPKRIKNAGAASRGELEEKLEKLGTSLEREKRTFTQTMLAQQWLQQQVKKDDETFTPEEIFNYYRQHTAEFEHTARVKWEELMVRKSRHPRRDEAVGLLGHLGNQVLDGAKLNEVARTGSEGSTARGGGLHDWTSKGSLVSETLENAIFSLPVGQLSQIIETDLGYHIVRVVERQDQSITPFAEAQVEIRNKIVRQRKKKQMDDYLAKLHDRTPIWTKYDTLMAQQPKSSSPFGQFER